MIFSFKHRKYFTKIYDSCTPPLTTNTYVNVIGAAFDNW